MVFYKEEEDMLKCWKHPSKHRSGGGICPLCLRDRLLRLCPDCANVRPCSCYPTSTTTTTTSSSSSSSSYSDVPTSFSSFGSGGRGSIGVIGRMSNLIDNEPSFQRSRSSTTAFPFLRSKISDTKDSNFSRLPPMGSSSSSSKSSFWSSMFKVPKLKKVEEEEEEEEEEEFEEKKNLNFKMMRSKSAGIPSSKNDVKSKGKKGGWNFPSPIKAFPFRQSNNNKTSSSSKVVQERSPLCRG
ncbi:hypothetical protein AQUCO_02600430v1 [Aquilegia coerulea]|uniref:DUF740 domain-containing protein n=1 Tax=Aquilegia coerulea TaxID=218851 RepID=A0A2G5D8Z7_AQUCA|nr:hypothetical protein AQUCO_02600430v1 [Aquilegia coerulea]